MSSSDLIRYGGGSLGLMNFENESTEGRTAFIEVDDPALELGRKAGVYAFLLDIIFLSMLAIHNYVSRFPYDDVLLTIFGAGIQMCLLVVYSAKDNGVCEVEGCSWGSGATWLFLTEIMMLSASIGTFYTSEKSGTMNQTKIYERTIRMNPHRRELDF